MIFLSRFFDPLCMYMNLSSEMYHLIFNFRPFNQCTKCGRQFYSRNSLQGPRNKQMASPENGTNETINGFSPQWTMDTLVGCPNDCQSKKDASYQMMNPPSDRASLCSHASHSSSASVASSSGSEYSVPRNYLETLYDR